MSRKITVDKLKLIEKIKENKKSHIKSYKKAVKIYKKEALKQLAELKREVSDGKLNIQLSLVTPIDNTDKYDKAIQEFEWDTKEFLELDQYEFNEYIHDETQFARDAKISNTYYMNSL